MVVSACIELSIFISHWIWLFRTRKLRKRAFESGQDFDSYAETMEWQEAGLKLDLFKRGRGRAPSDQPVTEIEYEERADKAV